MKKLVLIVAIGLFSMAGTNAQSLKEAQAKPEAKASASIDKNTDSKLNKKECDTKKVHVIADKKKSCATKKSCANKRRPNSCKD